MGDRGRNQSRVGTHICGDGAAMDRREAGRREEGRKRAVRKHAEPCLGYEQSSANHRVNKHCTYLSEVGLQAKLAVESFRLNLTSTYTIQMSMRFQLLLQRGGCHMTLF